MREIIAVAASYLLGCVSAGYYLVRLRTGQDIRRVGSGSAGGSNVGRLLGKRGFALTMAVDTLKGVAAMGLAVWLGVADWATALVAVGVVAGHVFPAQLGFRGGKGLSPALGGLLVFDAGLALILLGLSGGIGLLTRQMTLSLMAVMAATPLLAVWRGHSLIEAIGWGATVVLLWYAHRDNIAAALARLRGRAAEKR